MQRQPRSKYSSLVMQRCKRRTHGGCNLHIDSDVGVRPYKRVGRRAPNVKVAHQHCL
ncbi:Uncharacterised protein [Vibrio cholerae]|nr:Uncharacterised protein [Vibrio cholerae]CSB54916.1 Uncharacterised protein [Vibrio cholerae]CSC30922.1 Uncharacterised protein [Vibrio cholerae]CSI73946.1 Uncharacterised protein [Vibrio cholerae]